jgi:hypothetical protein
MIELAHIFRRHGPDYQTKFADRMLPSHRQAMRAIINCRTKALGGHVYHCDQCDEERYSYHSCRNRHCPKCQHDAAEQWLARQQDFLLPVPYFLLTFTLPAELRELARSNQRVIYNLLFRASAAASQRLARDPRFVGGQIGLVGVLHTWSRDLNYHPHVHYVVPGGGLSDDGQSWLPAREDFLVHVKPLSILFRAKFRDALKKTELFALVPPKTWQQEWVVHCQPVGNGEATLKYLAPYIFRVAISHKRILKLVHGKVTFRYTESSTGQTRLCTLAAEEFIRRFLQHVLPKGFVKVRYYGLFSPGLRHRLRQVRQLFGAQDTNETEEPSQETAPNSEVACRCPQCGQVMRLVQTVKPNQHRPP